MKKQTWKEEGYTIIYPKSNTAQGFARDLGTKEDVEDKIKWFNAIAIKRNACKIAKVRITVEVIR